jgi:segregation and condensation protein A
MDETNAPVLGHPTVNYHIRTEQFEGPLDLLLELIEKRKLFIGDFALAKVADEYIDHVRRFEAFPVAEVANFLLVASTLVLIKSRAILPELTLTKNEEEDINELKRRLELYELFRARAIDMKEHFGKRIIFPRSARSTVHPVFTPDSILTVATMSDGMMRVIHALPKKTTVPKATIKKVISIEEMMTRLSTRVSGALKMSFSNFARYERGKHVPKEVRVEIIVSFLAMLELVKQGIVHVSQRDDFGDIDIETQTFSTPSYTQ